MASGKSRLQKKIHSTLFMQSLKTSSLIPCGLLLEPSGLRRGPDGGGLARRWGRGAGRTAGRVSEQGWQTQGEGGWGGGLSHTGGGGIKCGMASWIMGAGIFTFGERIYKHGKGGN